MSSIAQEVKINERRGTEDRKKRNLFDKFVLVVAIVEPFATLPQLYQIWVKSDVAGVSVLTWFLYGLTECVWLAYGIKTKDKPVIAASIMWAVMEVLVAIGALVK